MVPPRCCAGLVAMRRSPPRRGAPRRLVARRRRADTRLLAAAAQPGRCTRPSGGSATRLPRRRASVVPLAPGTDRIRVQVSSPDALDAPFAGRHMVQRFSYRTVDGTVEVLNLSRKIRVRHADGERVTRESVALPGYEVDLVAWL